MAHVTNRKRAVHFQLLLALATHTSLPPRPSRPRSGPLEQPTSREDAERERGGHRTAKSLRRRRNNAIIARRCWPTDWQPALPVSQPSIHKTPPTFPRSEERDPSNGKIGSTRFSFHHSLAGSDLRRHTSRLSTESVSLGHRLQRREGLHGGAANRMDGFSRPASRRTH